MKQFFSLLAAIIVVLGLNQGSPTVSTHVNMDDFVTLEYEETASIATLEPIYQESRLYMSPPYEAPHNFQLLALNWKETLPDTTEANLEIRFRSSDGDWTDWQALNPDQDGQEYSDSLTSYVITENSDAFQYRANLSTKNDLVTPTLSDFSFESIDGGKDSILETLNKLIFKGNDDSVVSREDWGADESLRLAENHISNNSGSENIIEEDTVEDEDLDIINIIEEDEDGNALWWEQEYPKEIKKIIIHHTATTSNLDNPEQAIRAIYNYHAMTRNWGDIGYNYIIAPDGTVFEGRAGGEGVVAAHAAGYNTGSIGIALLGNYEDSPIPAEMMKSLTDLVYEKSDLHNIDPDGSKKYRGEVIMNILGHRDIGSTTCPGGYAYDYIPDLRDLVGDALDKRRHSNYDEDFAYEETKDRELITLDPQDTAGVSFRIKNIGSETWGDNTFLTVNVGDADEVITVDKDSNKAAAYMRENEVEPGETATFSFNIESKLSGGLVNLDVVPVFNGDEKSLHYMDIGVYVEAPYIDFDIESKDAPSFLKPGEKAEIIVKLKNTGNIVWTNSGDNIIKLKTSGSDLVKGNILAILDEKEVQPGETGTFTFTVSAPAEGGEYSLYYYPSLENGNAINGSSSSLSITVTDSDEDALIVDSSDDFTLAPGETQFAWVQIKNTSTDKWNAEDFDIKFTEPDGLEVTNQRMTVKTLSPGATSKIYFDITAPDEAGEYTLYIRPRLNNSNLTSTSYSLNIIVDESSFEAGEYEDVIRIKLTPDGGAGSPVITADSDFAVYDDEDLLKTFSANSRVRVTPEDNEFIITSGSYKWTIAGPVQLVPSDGGIMKIMTMNQRVSWDQSINDNRFRGTIEVSNVEDETILINELALEDYLMGLAEETNETPEEKLKVMAILARSYAYYYLTLDKKFPGMPYDGEDDPNTFQKYLGYGYELRHPNVSIAAQETAGTVVVYDGEVVKTPYFSRSDGGMTLSAESVWGWTNTPYLVPVDDSHCDSDEFWGHGVGLSGCGAKALAEDGYSFEEIIKYYYTGVELGLIHDTDEL